MKALSSKCFRPFSAKLIYYLKEHSNWSKGVRRVSLKSKLKVERLGVLVFSVFYAVVGGAETLLLVFSNFTLPHVAFLAVLSLTTAYGLLRTRRWSVWLATILFFPAITFGATTLYVSVTQQTFYPSLEAFLFHILLMVYLIMSVAAFAYVVAKRRDFQ